LKEYNSELLKKKEYVFVSKADLLEKKFWQRKLRIKEKLKGREVYPFPSLMLIL